MSTVSTAQSAVEIAESVRTGRITAATVVQEHLARIAALDGGLGAFQSVRAGALADAEAIDRHPERARLPLAGVPIAVKDNIAVAGSPVRHGSGATSDDPADHDDELVARLRAAGCVVVGTTRMPELAAWPFTASTAFGVTRNPWDPSRDPGGSTGGGAAAVAAGMAALALGTDGGGSIRIPAAHCGLAGLKPTAGVIGLPGGLTEHWYGLTVSGPIARTSADLAAALAILAGDDFDVSEPPRPLRIALSLRSPSPIARPDAHQRAAIAAAVDILAAAGHTVVRAEPPYPPTLLQRWSRRWWAGIAQDADRLGVAEDRLEPRTRTMVRKGRRVLRFGGPKPEVAAAWRRAASDWLSAYDVMLSPVVATVAGPAGALNGRGYLATFLAAARSNTYCQAWNLAGLPALVVPVGVRDGVPLAVQLVGLMGADRALLALGTQLERPATPVI